MEAETSTSDGALPRPEAETSAEIVARGEFGLTIGHLEFIFANSRLSDPGQHVAAVQHLIRAGVFLREQSYEKYLNTPLVTEIPIGDAKIRADIRLCGYGLGKYSVENGSIKIRSLLLIGISFQVLNFSYDAVSKYPDFKEGFLQISEDISARLEELEVLLMEGDNRDEPPDVPKILFVATRPEEIFEELRKRVES